MLISRSLGFAPDSVTSRFPFWSGCAELSSDWAPWKISFVVSGFLICLVTSTMDPPLYLLELFSVRMILPLPKTYPSREGCGYFHSTFPSSPMICVRLPVMRNEWVIGSSWLGWAVARGDIRKVRMRMRVRVRVRKIFLMAFFSIVKKFVGLLFLKMLSKTRLT